MLDSKVTHTELNILLLEKGKLTSFPLSGTAFIILTLEGLLLARHM